MKVRIIRTFVFRNDVILDEFDLGQRPLPHAGDAVLSRGEKRDIWDVVFDYQHDLIDIKVN